MMELNELRKEIDKIDSELSELFCRRMEISRAIGEWKKENSLPVLDSARERDKLLKIAGGSPEKYRAYIEKLYGKIFSLSRGVQTRCGLLGEKLSHSYSPMIHSRLADYEYKLYEKSPEELEDFILNAPWDGLNVTIPYKKTVLKYCGSLSERAMRIGSVNTLKKGPEGIYGDNTDACGFEALVEKLGVSPAGKKAIVLGSGGASAAVCAVLEDMGVRELRVISRRGRDNYENIAENYDAEFIVNTTPLGMYPDTGKAAIDLRGFKNCRAVIDLVYNPARTALIMQAEELDIPCAGGLYMLVSQARASAEIFSGQSIAPELTDKIYRALKSSMENMLLIGMPGCGKSTVGRELARLSGREFYDSDAEIEKRMGMSIPDIFKSQGEEGFRRLETELLSRLCKVSGAVISCGGGAVTRKENYPLMHQNSEIVYIKRKLEELPTQGRPLSQKSSVYALYEERRGLYESFCDLSVDNDTTPEKCAERILEALQ